MTRNVVKRLSQLKVRKDIVEVLICQPTLRCVLKVLQVSIAVKNDRKPASQWAAHISASDQLTSHVGLPLLFRTSGDLHQHARLLPSARSALAYGVQTM